MNKKIIFILVPIVLIIIIAIVITVLYFSTDLFKSNEDLFWKYFAQNENIFDVMQNDETTSQNNFKQNNSYEGSGNCSVHFRTVLYGEDSDGWIHSVQ